ncbi:ABC transporter ATP-binding protein [Xenophilus sp.]|uniref:ABC transporter ATP-binding protein n=1 Tax=Xenophilus sp. TaxID=1873499 RepID=UPI0037DD577A
MPDHDSPQPLLSLRGITRRYSAGSGRVTALDDVSLAVRDGEFVSILGPSGCGKSTLLSVLGLLERPDAGSYRIRDIDTGALGFDQRSSLRNRYIGLVFQAFNLVANLTVAENVALPTRYGNVDRDERDARVHALLERVNLLDRARHYPHELSGGQQQRAAIARAMVMGPSLILADEPTGNLDSRHATDVMGLVREFNEEGATVVLVTHDLGLAQMAGRRLHMLDGRFVEAS